MNANSRFYLHRTIDDTHSHRGSDDRMGLFQDDTLSENEFIDHDGSIFDIEKTRRVLDLGTISLQRVITQMKGLRSNNSGELKYNPDASRVAGLNTYCNYLVGKATTDKLPTVEQILSKKERR